MLTRNPLRGNKWTDDRGSVTEFAVVMIGVFFLLSLGLMTAVNFLAAQAASTAAQSGLAIAQTPGQSSAEARAVSAHLAAASAVVTSTRPQVVVQAQSVRVVVRVHTVVGSDLSRTASGPLLRFVPQNRR